MPGRTVTVFLRIDGGQIGHYFPLVFETVAETAHKSSQETILYGVHIGALMFMAVVIFLVLQNPPAAVPETPIITYAAYGLSAFSGIASLVVPNLISNRARQSLIAGGVSNWGLVKDLPNAAELGDVAPLAAIYQTRTITSAALVQGAVFLACVAYLLEHQRPVLIVAGVLLLMIISKFPTVSGLESSIESDAATVQLMRQLR